MPLPVPGESGHALLVALRVRGLYLDTVIAGEAVQRTLLGQQPTAVLGGGGEDTRQQAERSGGCCGDTALFDQPGGEGVDDVPAS